MAAPYNVVLQLQLQSPTNLSSVISDIQRRLSGINASVNIQLNASSVQALAQLNQQLGALQGNLNNVSSQASNAASNVNKLTAAHSAASNQVANSNAQLANSSGVMRANQIATSEASHALENFGVQAGLAARRYSAFLLAGGAIITFANELRSALGDALRFQREMVRLSQIGNETTGSLRDMESEVTRLATTWGTSSRELISATVQLRQAGLTATDTKIALDALAKSSLAPSFGSMTETAEGLIAVMNQFKVSATEAAGVLGSINAVSTQYAVSSRDIIDAVRRTGGEFRSAGGNINELIALFGAVRSTSRESAESIGTSLRTIFARVQRASVIEDLRRLNIELLHTREEAARMGDSGLAGQFVGPYEAVRRLSGALSGLRSTDPRYAGIAEQLGGYRQLEKVIPLLQEFGRAQNIYQTAQAGSNSLTRSAEQAQEAFLVRLTKVREEFSALIRTITESKGFQVFLDMVIQLTSAFTQLAGVLSPLIPLIAGVATFKLAQGIGRIGGGLLAGLGGQSPSYGAAGAGIRGYASGGVVPGVGDSDSVYANLTPGEYVIRKQAARRIGYRNLERINRYADGGSVRMADGGDPQRFYAAPAISDQDLRQMRAQGMTAEDISLEAARRRSTRLTVAGGDISAYLNRQSVTAMEGINPNSVGVALQMSGVSHREQVTKRQTAVGEFEKQYAGKLGDTYRIPYGGDSLGLIGFGPVSQAGQSVQTTNIDTLEKLNLNPNIASVLKERGIKSIHGQVTSHILSANATERFNTDISNKVAAGIQGAFKTSFPKSTHDFKLSSGQMHSINGYLLEQYITGLSDKIPGGNNVDFDFTNVGSFKGTELADVIYPKEISANLIDAKRSVDASTRYTVLGKYLNYKAKLGDRFLTTSPEKRASGGIVDSVPALLTPGEFVINASAAQRIGYSNLDQMNRTGLSHFADGGSVHLAYGTNDGGRRRPASALELAALRAGQLPDVARFIGMSTGVSGYTPSPFSAVPGAELTSSTVGGGFTPVSGAELPNIYHAPTPASTAPVVTNPTPTQWPVPHSGFNRWSHESGYSLAPVGTPINVPQTIPYSIEGNPPPPVYSGGLSAFPYQGYNVRPPVGTLAQGVLAPRPGPAGPSDLGPTYGFVSPGYTTPGMQAHLDEEALNRRIDPGRAVGARSRGAERALREAQLAAQDMHTTGYATSDYFPQEVGPHLPNMMTARRTPFLDRISSVASIAEGPSGTLSDLTQRQRRLQELNKIYTDMVKSEEQILAKEKASVPLYERKLMAVEQTERNLREMEVATKGALSKAANAAIPELGKGTVREMLDVQTAAAGAPPTTGSRLGRFAGYLRNNGRMIGGALGTVGLMYGSQAILGAGGTAEQAAMSGTGGNYVAAQSVGGALQGAATGAAIGSFLGPWGTAVGAVIGGLGGLATSFFSASREIEKATLQIAQRNSGEALTRAMRNQTTATGAFDVENSEYNRRVAQITQGESRFLGIRSRVARPITNAEREAIRAETFGATEQRYGEYLQSRATVLARRNPNMSTQQLSEALSRENYGQASTVLGNRADTVINETAAATRRQVGAEVGRAQAAVIVQDFQALTMALRNATSVVSEFSRAAQLSSAVFGGQVTAGTIANPAENINQLGGPNPEDFRGSVNRIASGFGARGNTFRQTGYALDDVRRQMIAALPALATGGQLQPESYRERLTTGVNAGLGGARNAYTERILESSGRVLGGMSPADIETHMRENPEGLVDRILRPIMGPFQQHAQEMGQLLQQAAQAFANAVTTFQQQMQRVGQIQDTAARAQTTVVRETALTAGRANFSAGTALYNLPMETLQMPFTARQQRLTAGAGLRGAAAFDPEAIGNALLSTNRQISGLNRQRENTPFGPAMDSLTERIGHLTATSSNLQQALEHLSNAANANAAIEERLAALHRDQEGRFGLAERFLTGDPRARMQLMQGQQLSQMVAGQGAQAGYGLSTTQLGTFFQFAQSAPGTMVGGRTLEDLRRLVIANRGDQIGGLFAPRGRAGEIGDLEGQRLGGIRNAAAAQGTFGRVLGTMAEEQFTGARGLIGSINIQTRLANNIQSLDSAVRSLTEVILRSTGQGGGGTFARAFRMAGYAQGGDVFRPRGSDIVPAMLTPGEFVVNRDSAQRHRQLLEHINNNRTAYMADGGEAPFDINEWRRRRAEEQAGAERGSRSAIARMYGRREARADSNEAYLNRPGGSRATGFSRIGDTSDVMSGERPAITQAHLNYLAEQQRLNEAGSGVALSGARGRAAERESADLERSRRALAGLNTGGIDRTYGQTRVFTRNQYQGFLGMAVGEAPIFGRIGELVGGYIANTPGSIGSLARAPRPRTPGSTITASPLSGFATTDVNSNGALASTPAELEQTRLNRTIGTSPRSIEALTAGMGGDMSIGSIRGMIGQARNLMGTDFARGSYASTIGRGLSGLNIGQTAPGIADQYNYGNITRGRIAQTRTSMEMVGSTIDARSGMPGLFGRQQAAMGAAADVPTVSANSWALDRSGNIQGQVVGGRFVVSPNIAQGMMAGGARWTNDDLARMVLRPGSGVSLLNQHRDWTIQRFASGGYVYGAGISDSTPALLSAGEFVLNSRATRNVGVDNLQRFNEGGPVGYYANGNIVSPTNPEGGGASFAPTNFREDIGRLQSVFTNFTATANSLAAAISKIPPSIQLSANHNLNVNVSGAEAFESMKATFGKMIVSYTEDAINNLISQKFPEVGRVDSSVNNPVSKTSNNYGDGRLNSNAE